MRLDSGRRKIGKRKRKGIKGKKGGKGTEEKENVRKN